ncbi:MAG: molybdopterin converting factor subunit 1 [Candidatus Thiodiazotropha sp. (ex Monitilora ramsayi)]|nr:molybdopterin converting factor subunit 1 [Candidatus Thiodiazotropha sp. (ex Monitilora ramsayi)]
MIEVRFFARFREELGADTEQLEAGRVNSVEDLLTDLRGRGGAWSRLFAEDQRVMAAVNQEVADQSTPLKDGDEVAFFPPVTGG